MENSKRPTLYQHLFEVAVIMTAGLGIGLITNQFRDQPLALIYESKAQRLEAAVRHISTEAPTPIASRKTILPMIVTIEQLQTFMNEKQGLVLDARPEIFYRFGHIPGAVSFPREDFENIYKTFQSQLEKDRSQPLIIYCASTSCEDASLVQKSLLALGYSNAAVFAGGWAEWQEKGLPVEAKE